MDLCKAHDLNNQPRNKPHEYTDGLYGGELERSCIFCSRLETRKRPETIKHESRYPVCQICRGRGEVSAGITYMDEHREVRVERNPKAGELMLQTNPVLLWGIATCGECHGTGMQR